MFIQCLFLFLAILTTGFSIMVFISILTEGVINKSKRIKFTSSNILFIIGTICWVIFYFLTHK